jgi:2-polyprenyl-6-methoxyphenol hydroxylase-like FAD-dependent oxidoreductase
VPGVYRRGMRVAIAGAGPVGLFTAVALARRGHEVTVVDRDPGPAADGTWERRGVMQFHHPHGLRAQVTDALAAEAPDVRESLLAAGAVEIRLPDGPQAGRVVGMQCRRSTLERHLRATAVAEPGVTFVAGHVDEVPAAGLRVDGSLMDADLVIDATGRNGRLAGDGRAPAEGADCGLAYVSRHYELQPRAEPGPQNSLLGLITRFPGYLAGVFLQDARTVCLLIARLSTDRELAGLRETAVFDAAVRIIPGLIEWTDPARTRPISPVLPGGHLHNAYRGQLGPDGRLPRPGLVHLGDTVCTTNPTAGRGLATGFLQARAFLRLLAETGGDVPAATLALDEWCTREIRPWFDDHMAWDPDEVALMSGADVDLTRPLTSGWITAAVEADPSLMSVVGPYLGMFAPPASLRAIEPRVRALYAGGWRPAVPAGPTRDDLADLVRRTSARPHTPSGPTAAAAAPAR